MRKNEKFTAPFHANFFPSKQFDEIFAKKPWLRVKFRISTECVSLKIIFSWNQLFIKLFSKNVDLTKFLTRKCERISAILRERTLWILQNFCITTFWKISVKTISLVNSFLNNWFHEMIFKWYKNNVNSTQWSAKWKNKKKNPLICSLKKYFVKSTLYFSFI